MGACVELLFCGSSSPLALSPRLFSLPERYVLPARLSCDPTLYDDVVDSVRVALLSDGLWRYLKWGWLLFTKSDRGVLKRRFHLAIRYIQHMLHVGLG